MEATSKRFIGSWGIHIMFYVGLDVLRTFRDLTETISARWAEHDILYNGTRLEYLGPAPREITMNVDLIAELGAKPMTVIRNMQKHILAGTADYLIIGGKKWSPNKFVVTNMDVEYKRHYLDGQPTFATASLTFKEYYEGT